MILYSRCYVWRADQTFTKSLYPYRSLQFTKLRRLICSWIGLIWNFADQSFGWFLWYFNGTFLSFFELDFHWWRNNQSPVFLVNGWTDDAAPVLLVQACLVRNTHICTCIMGKSLYTYAWQTCTTGPAE